MASGTEILSYGIVQKPGIFEIRTFFLQHRVAIVIGLS